MSPVESKKRPLDKSNKEPFETETSFWSLSLG